MTGLATTVLVRYLTQDDPVQAQEEWPEEDHRHLGFAGDQGPVRKRRLPDELHIGKPLSFEECFRNILRGLTDACGPGQP